MRALRNFQAKAIAAALAERNDSQSWIKRPADFYAIRHAAKHIGPPRGMSRQAYKLAKVAERNDMHSKMDEIRTHNVCQADSAASCRLRELADLRARVTRPDTYRCCRIQFRPFFYLL